MFRSPATPILLVALTISGLAASGLAASARAGAFGVVSGAGAPSNASLPATSPQGASSPTAVSVSGHSANARMAKPWKNQSWLNASAPVTLESLRGRVVLLNFWVYTCGNCQRTIPSLKVFDTEFRDRGLSIIGIHTPEFPPYAGEHDKGNVKKAIARYGIAYPVAQDNDNATWNLYHIQYWPSLVLIDRQGQIRYEDYGEFHVGDTNHKAWEQRIAALLAE